MSWSTFLSDKVIVVWLVKKFTCFLWNLKFITIVPVCHWTPRCFFYLYTCSVHFIRRSWI